MSYKEEIVSLTIRDRMNFPYLLANQVLTIQKSILNQEFSEREIQEAVNGLVQMVPDSWKDEEWYDALDKALVKRIIDVRPDFCGVTATEKWCKEYGIVAFIEEDEFDSYRLFHAVICLLDRRGLISRQTFTEKIPSKKRIPNVQVDP